MAALVEWSGAVYTGYDEDPEAHDQARTDGFVTVGGGFQEALTVTTDWLTAKLGAAPTS